MKALVVRIRGPIDHNWFEVAGSLKAAEAHGFRVNTHDRKTGERTVTISGDVPDAKLIDVLLEVISLLDADSAESFDINVRPQNKDSAEAANEVEATDNDASCVNNGQSSRIRLP